MVRPGWDEKPTVSQMGEFCGLSDTTINRLLARGILPKGVDLKTAVQKIIAHYSLVAAGRASINEDGDGLDLTAERARLAKAQADKTELDCSRMRGELIDVGIAMDEWRQMIGASRAKIMSIPSRASGLLAGVTDDAGIEKILDKLCRESLQELSGWRGD